MLIVLEGPDGSGKSYLADQLRREFDLEYHHEGPPPQDVPILEYYTSILLRLVPTNTVIDRFALGERVYGPHYRGHDALGELGWIKIRRLMETCRVVQVLCLPSYEVCYEAWSSGREELFKSEEVFKQTYKTYTTYKQNQFLYDYTDPLAYGKLCEVIRDHNFNV